MDVTVTINAPAIVEAINNLAGVFSAVISATGSWTTLAVEDTAQDALSPAPQLPANGCEIRQPNAQTAQNAFAMPSQPVQQAATNIPQNTPNAAYDASQQAAPVDDAYRNKVCNAAARLIEQGKMPDVLNLLGSYGVAAVTQLTAAQLPDFANRLIAMGAVI